MQYITFDFKVFEYNHPVICRDYKVFKNKISKFWENNTNENKKSTKQKFLFEYSNSEQAIFI